MTSDEELYQNVSEHVAVSPATGYPNVAKRFRFEPEVVDSSREGVDAWVMTYLDLITLLLTLFILLLSYAERGTGKYKEVTPVQIEAVKEEAREVIKEEFKVSEPPSVIEDPISPLDIMQDDLQQKFATVGLSSGIEIIHKEGALDIQLSEKVLFSSGEASFNSRAAAVLRPLLDVLKDTDYTITVEGHTDNIPIYTERFPSNWELSSSRATSVVRYLIKEGIDPGRLKAVGYADTQPITDNNSAEGRARNRRVTLVISYPTTPLP